MSDRTKPADQGEDSVVSDTVRTDRAPSGRSSSSLAEITTDQIQDMEREELLALWFRIHKKPAPPFFRRALLIRALSYEIQVHQHGGLSRETRRTLLKIAAQAEQGPFKRSDMPFRLRPGTRLIRSHKGKVHTVEVLQDGFEWKGRRYGSLTAIATEISGTRWNGYDFFGIDRKSRKGKKTGEVSDD